MTIERIREKTVLELQPQRLEDNVPAASITLQLSSLPVEPAVDGCVLDGVLCEAECKRLIDSVERGGFSFWDPEGPSDRALSHRSADTVEFRDQALCEALWERLRPHVPTRCDISADQLRYEPDLEGSWVATGLNPHLLVNRYGSGGHFAPHADGSTVVDFNTRSLYTVLVYLNDCADGGATQILGEEQGDATELDGRGAAVARRDAVVYPCQPVTGRVLMYWHQVMHAGETVGKGCTKYCLRSDVMYTRDPPSCTEPHDLEAFALLQRARALEAEGRSMEAMGLFRRARRLSTGIARAFRL